MVVFGQFSLGINGAAEFASADHDGVLEQSALLEVPYESGRRLVDVLALLADFGREAAVLVPTPMKELYERNAPLGEPAGDQAIVGKAAMP